MSRKIYLIVEEELSTGEVKRITHLIPFSDLMAARAPAHVLMDNLVRMFVTMKWPISSLWGKS